MELSGGALPAYVRPWVPSPAPQNEARATVVWNMCRSTFDSWCVESMNLLTVWRWTDNAKGRSEGFIYKLGSWMSLGFLISNMPAIPSLALRFH